jgi:hypothetical protein
MPNMPNMPGRPARTRPGGTIALCFLCLLRAAGAAGAEERPLPPKIPILFSDHHADHARWLLEQLRRPGPFREAEDGEVSLVVVDAHADTAPHPARDLVRDRLRRGDYQAADAALGNHNWIGPLVPSPVRSLVWVTGVSGFPGDDRYAGFIKSTAGWNIPRRCVTLDELDAVPPGGVLFVSIDLDFFYYDGTPRDIPPVFDRLLDLSLRREGEVIWAVCVSRAWLPADEYAWELLQESLAWLASRAEFAAPALTLFSGDRRDTSRRAEAARAGGAEPPGLYRKEAEMPARLREILSLTAARTFTGGERAEP